MNKDITELETERFQYAELAESKRAQIAKLLGELEQDEKVEQRRKRELALLKRQQEEEQARQQSQEQAESVAEDIAALEEDYRTKAINKPWYSGNDDVDPILPFQWKGALFGAGAKRWILGDGMGLGKTRQSIGWLDLVDARKVLIVCQADICDQFAGEVMTLAPHRSAYNLYKKTPKLRHRMVDKIILSKDEAVVIVNYEIWRKDKQLLAKLASWQFDTMIVDEAHNLKNTASSNYRYIKHLCQVDNQCGGCGFPISGLYDEDKKPRLVAKPCPACGWTKGQTEHEYQLDGYLESKSIKNVCFTTGTPLLNSPLDIYSLLHLCDPILFASKTRFMSTFCTTNYHNGKVEFKAGQLERLKPLIAGRFIARTRDDAGIVLPIQRKHIVRVDIDQESYPKQWKVIKDLSERAIITLENGEMMTIMHLISLITRKRQANVYPAGITLTDSEGNIVFSVGQDVTESVKFDVVEENILRLHAEGRRQVVFSQFSTALKALADRLTDAGLRVALLTGETPRTLRQEIKDNFYLAKGEAPKWDVVLCNYKTGGTGLNLTAATATHIMDEEWNPGKRDQAYARTDRIGQELENDVYIYRIPASIDTWMSNTIHRKEQMVSAFVGTMTDDEMTADGLADAMRTGAIL